MSMFQTFKAVVRDEGYLALFKGNLAATYLWVTYAAIQFSVYASVSEYLTSSDDVWLSSRNCKNTAKPFHPSAVAFIAGATAGLAATIATYPFDFCRTSFASNPKKNISLHLFMMTTLKTKGLPRFYAGCVPALVSVVPLMGLSFSTYEKITSAMTQLGLEKNSGFAGAISGGFSKFVVYPLDTIKKRLQAQAFIRLGDASSTVIYRNAIDCGLKIVTDEGFSTLYRGLGPTLIKSAVSTGLTFSAFNASKSFLEKHHDDN